MTLRSGVRPSLPFVYSLFVYVTRIRKITVALLTAVLLSNPAAAATLGAAPFAANKGQDLRYESIMWILTDCFLDLSGKR
jgi:hypothetical protein